jgi:hypothetical protein
MSVLFNIIASKVRCAPVDLPSLSSVGTFKCPENSIELSGTDGGADNQTSISENRFIDSRQKVDPLRQVPRGGSIRGLAPIQIFTYLRPKFDTTHGEYSTCLNHLTYNKAIAFLSGLGMLNEDYFVQTTVFIPNSTTLFSRLKKGWFGRIYQFIRLAI